MITFKQYIAEINFDDSNLTKLAADMTIDKIVLDGYKNLDTIKINGFDVLWKEVGPRAYHCVLASKNKALIVIDLAEHSITVPGGHIKGVITHGLYSHQSVRGKGLALELYEGLVKNGQVLFSSDHHTTGSRKLWENLTRFYPSFVVVNGSASRYYIDKYPKYEHRKARALLLKGSLESLQEEAYASDETYWLVLPKNFDNLAAISSNALEL